MTDATPEGVVVPLNAAVAQAAREDVVSPDGRCPDNAQTHTRVSA